MYKTNFAKSIFHAQNLIKTKQIKINNKLITSANYIVKPFSKLICKSNKKEFTLLNKIKANNLINKNNIIKKEYIYKNENYNFPANIKKYRK